MNIQAIRHRSRGLDCFPSGDSCFVIRFRTARGDFDSICIEYKLNRFDWYRERSLAALELEYSTELFDYYRIELGGSDTRLAYIFRLEKDGQLWYYSEEGLSRHYNYDFGHFTYFQYPFINSDNVHRVPDWVNSAVVYQIFPERFSNGLGSKPHINAEWGAPVNPKSFFGGDLVGIYQKLDYLSELGVTLLYLTPICVSDSNHKYDVIDYFHVDPAFGGDEAFLELVRRAHSLGIRVMTDGVFNHCSSRNPIFLDAQERGKDSPYCDWFYFDEGAECGYLTFASVPYMPKMNTNNPEVIDYFCKVGRYWIENFDIDGWRLDVADELSDGFLRSFRKAVKDSKPDALIISENWHNPDYQLMGDMCDGVMQYGFTKACLDFLASGTIDVIQFHDRLVSLAERISEPALKMSFTLLDSHDIDRFLTQVSGDKLKIKMAYAMEFFFVGIPFVYYGDEIGLEGGYDPDCRRCFLWDESRQDHDLHGFIQLLCRMKRYPAMSSGRLKLGVEGKELCFIRSFENDECRLCVDVEHGRLAITHGDKFLLKID